MRKCLAGVMCAAFVVAASNEATAIEGAELFEFATSDKPMDVVFYTGYVLGVVSGYSLSVQAEGRVTFCLKEEWPPAGDFGDIVRVWLRQNPDAFDVPAQLSVVAAIATYFPCETE